MASRLFGGRPAWDLDRIAGEIYGFRAASRLFGVVGPRSPAPSFWAVVRFLFSNPVLRNVVVAGTLTAFAGYASVIWVPIYLVRIHEMGTGEAGTYLALTLGVGGAVGIYLGGRIADHLGKKYGEHWLAWLVAIVGMISVPFMLLCFFAETAESAILAYAIPAFLGTIYVACGFALIQNYTPLEMRSVCAAINLFILNIIGLGLGPFTIGFLSDLFEPSMGQDSLRYGLLATLVAIVLGCWYYYRTGVLILRSATSGIESRL